jgi:hypothetical protein
MISKKLIEKLKDTLGRGDQARIAKLAGLSKVTVHRFMKGINSDVSDESAAKIIKTAAIVVRDRKKLRAKNVKLMESVTKTN